MFQVVKDVPRDLMLLICASVAGEKVPLPVVGQFSKPADWLPVKCKANKKAWLTSLLFDEWLLKFYKELRAINCNVALILNDCAAHSVNAAAFTNISVCYVPHTSMSTTELMDTGIIRDLKLHYCHNLVHK